MIARAGAGTARSTAAVLWLMILLVFLPLAALHGLARLGGAGPVEPEAQHASLPAAVSGALTPAAPIAIR